MAKSVALQCHPDTPCGPLTGMEVEVGRHGSRSGLRRIALRFIATGKIDALRFAHHVKGHARKDELWRTTCFEAFLRVGEDSAYREFNFAPSGEWNCYRFTRYREGMVPEKHVGDPAIGTYLRHEPLSDHDDGLAAGLGPLDRFDTPFFMLTATLELQPTMLPLDAPWHLALSAVIEERNGRISYWALKHPPGKPDFHHQDCFALELPAAMPS
ncbi:DOMON-like domain-containing protein [Allosphingosinicella flava]|uniref:DOMON-like domain-containing protein n=1 Tax=Allosphingosinicella flava TaxID=2771430 RepID=A0A7T2LMN5_9SPHN|nr:DOMON-like domain-containing protein [Sphingosinicella flava]QPQ55765.1 DOMON-like domain-containing protein [Sphingosinicella flava]